MNHHTLEYSKMKTQTLLTGLRPGHDVERYRSRIEQFVAHQSSYRPFVLIADCQAIAEGSIRSAELEASVQVTVEFLIDSGFDTGHAACFLQSQVPQLSELARMLEGVVGASAGTQLACNAVRFPQSMSEVADMLMLRPDLILGGQGDRPDFEVATMVGRMIGGPFGRAAFHEVPVNDIQEEGSSERSLSTTTGIADLLSYGGSAARIEAQKSLELIRQRAGFNYAMFK